MATNPLHDDDGAFLENFLESLLAAANHGDDYALPWIRRIHQHGVTKQLARDLNSRLSQWPITAYFSFDAESTDFVPKYRLPKNPPDLGMDFIIAFHIARLLADGRLDDLKRCEECRNYHVRGPLAKWCSDGCGSGKRQRDKRKRDRERQMML